MIYSVFIGFKEYFGAVMISIKNVDLSFGQQAIFKGLSCNINCDYRVGLVGRNGSGKSTLLKVLAGMQGIDEGVVSIEKGITIGYMPQEMVLHSSKNVFDEALSAFGEAAILEDERKDLEKKIDDADPSVIDRYAVVQIKLAELDIDRAKVETKKILMGLGFSEESLKSPVQDLSVGWKMRVVLAKLLLQKADFYLFDEPTNHLDIVTKDWFLQFVKKSNFGFMLVCHDRYFLEHLCERILELEKGMGTIYLGNFSSYVVQKEERQAALEKAYERQQKDIAQRMKTVERFRYSASKAKMAQSMLKSIEKIDRISITSGPKSVAFSFPPIERSGRVVLEAKNLSYAYGANQIFKDVSFEVERGEKVALIAANGVGKTTLFNIITGRLERQKGSITLGYNVSTSLFEQDQDAVLSPNNTVLEEVEASCTDSETRKKVRKFLGSFLFSGDDADKKIRVLSGGEKNRVAMVKVLLQRANLLLLDEPTNHLDIQSKEVLLNALRQFKGTILFVSHDRDFLDKLSTRVFELTPNGIYNYPGNYESYLYHKHKKEHDLEEKTHSKNSKSAETKKLSGKEEYERRKELGRVESKISRLEKEIDDLNHKLSELEYGTDAFVQIYQKLQKTQTKLDEQIERWETFQK
jgi:ATP-binding cassette, subfamily F, member 3